MPKPTAFVFVSLSIFFIFHPSYFILASDWPQLQCNPQRTGRSEERSDIPEGAKHVLHWAKKFWPDRVNNGVQAIIAEGKVYIGSMGGKLYCLDEQDGGELWVAQCGGPVMQAAGYIGGKVVIGSLDGKVYAFDAATGALAWTAAGPRGFSSAPLIAEDSVFIGARGGEFFRLDPADGRALWRAETGSQILQTAAYDQGRVFFGTEDCLMRAYDARTGGLLWKKGPFPTATFSQYHPVAHKARVIFRGQTPQRFKEGPPAEYPYVSGWDKAGGKLSADIPIWDALLKEGKPLPDIFTAAGDRLAAWFRDSPDGRAHQSLFVLNAETGGEDFIIPHWHGGSLCGPTPPPAVDGDGMLLLPVSCGSCLVGQIDLEKRRVVDILFELSAKMKTAYDETRNFSTAGDLVFVYHKEEGNCAVTGAFDLRTRNWWPRPTGGGGGYWFEKVGAACSLSNGRFYHVSADTLNVRGWIQ